MAFKGIKGVDLFNSLPLRRLINKTSPHAECLREWAP